MLVLQDFYSSNVQMSSIPNSRTNVKSCFLGIGSRRSDSHRKLIGMSVNLDLAKRSVYLRQFAKGFV